MYLEQALEVGRDEAQLARLCVSALCDLCGQGWSVRLGRAGLEISRPTRAADPTAEKERVRGTLLIERNARLAEPSTRQFIQEMESRRIGPAGWVSVFSLMRDGEDLAAKLDAVNSAPGDEQDRLLREVIKPYVQLADDGVCDYTGIPLKHIWRYFRYTWASPHKTVPGRNLWFLIRDGAAPCHPIIGIASLSSPFVQMRLRDDWVGWSTKSFLRMLMADDAQHDKWSGWLGNQLDLLIGDVYAVDLIASGALVAEELVAPTNETLARLNAVADEARAAHYAHGSAKDHKSAVDDWASRAQTSLFVWKRASTLAELLGARLQLQRGGFNSANPSSLRSVLDTATGRRAVAQVLRRVKARHVGHDVADITVCGAVAPYNALLGGKLVSMLMAGPEVARAYEDRYADAESIIASGVAGGAITRRPRLVLLGTTSFYGVGSSQYNRVRIPAEAVGGERGKEVRFLELGLTEGYGSLQFSEDTMQEVRTFLAQRAGGRKVKYIFGEGVNPRMREVRNAFDKAGLPADDLLRHESYRVIYGVPLAENFREVLVGLEREPTYLLPQEPRRDVSQGIVDHWVERWLRNRVKNPAVLEQVACNTLTFPVSHGARVDRPAEASDDDQLMLTWDEELMV
jgi:hypothetical protein